MSAISLDETHDARRQSWVASANGHPEFPLQNLPFGVFSPGGAAPRGGVAIGDRIFDLKEALAAGLFSGETEKAAAAAAGSTLNPWMALAAGTRSALRRRVSALLDAGGAERAKVEKLAAKILHRAADCALAVPAAIGDFTDFFAGIHHAYNGGVRNKRNPPLLAAIRTASGMKVMCGRIIRLALLALGVRPQVIHLQPAYVRILSPRHYPRMSKAPLQSTIYTRK